MFVNPFIHTRARRLTRLFMEGRTSLDEERWLEQYYAGAHVCRSLQAFRPMFLGLHSMHATKETPFIQQSSRRVWSRWVAVAAVVSLLAGGGWRIYDRWQYRQLELLYEGSYCIEDGRRTDDLHKLRPRIRQTLAMASEVERRVTQTRQIEDELLNNVVDEEQRQMLRRMLE